jgi:adenylate kinase family enzyme
VLAQVNPTACVVGPEPWWTKQVARRLATKLGVALLNPAALLAAAASDPTELGARVKEASTEPGDGLTVEVLARAASGLGCKLGWVVEGFPATPRQAQLMEAAGLIPTQIFELSVSLTDGLVRADARFAPPTQDLQAAHTAAQAEADAIAAGAATQAAAEKASKAKAERHATREAYAARQAAAEETGKDFDEEAPAESEEDEEDAAAAGETETQEAATVGLKAAFDGVDADDDGSVNKKELAAALQANEALPALVEAAGFNVQFYVLEQLDSNVDGRLTWDEFCANLSPPAAPALLAAELETQAVAAQATADAALTTLNEKQRELREEAAGKEAIRLQEAAVGLAGLELLAMALHDNYYVLDGTKSCWWLYAKAGNVVAENLKRRQMHIADTASGRAAPLYDLGTTPFQLAVGHASAAGTHCPVSLLARGLFLQAEGKPDLVAAYNGCYYSFAGNKEHGVFVGDPAKGVPTEVPECALELSALARVKMGAEGGLALEGCCPVTAAVGGPVAVAPKLAAGDGRFMASFGGATFSMASADALQKFLRCAPPRARPPSQAPAQPRGLNPARRLNPADRRRRTRRRCCQRAQLGLRTAGHRR